MKNRKRWVSVMAGVMAAVMLLSLIAMLLPTPASASVSSEMRAQINDLRAQRNEIKNQRIRLRSIHERLHGRHN